MICKENGGLSSMSKATQHFDQIAKGYDYYKKIIGTTITVSTGSIKNLFHQRARSEILVAVQEIF